MVKGFQSLSVADRMTIANLASEMGAKNAVFPADDVLTAYLGKKYSGVWADQDAVYLKEYEIQPGLAISPGGLSPSCG